MNKAPNWVSKPMVWHRFNYSDANTFPPYGTSVLWCDEIQGMVVAYLDRSHDIIVSTSSFIVECLLETGDYEEMEEKLKAAVVEISNPFAWMALPPLPVQMVDNEEIKEEAVMRTADIVDELEPILRNMIAAKLAGGQ